VLTPRAQREEREDKESGLLDGASKEEFIGDGGTEDGGDSMGP
jgi:hypothetical protein